MRKIVPRKIDGRRNFASHSGGVQYDYQPSAIEIEWLKFLNVHTFATSELLYELTKDMVGGRDRNELSKKLLTFWNKGWIARPQSQRNLSNCLSNYHVFSLWDGGENYLKVQGLLVEAIRPSGNFDHQMMIAYITGTIDIMCRREGYKFIPAHEYLQGLPLKIDSVPFKIDGAKRELSFTPDSVFAIDYGLNERGASQYVAYCLEADRNTKPLTSTDWKRNSDHRNILQYKTLLGEKLYKTAYKREALMVCLYITVSEGKQQSYLNLVEQTLGNVSYIATGVIEEFATPIKLPKMPKHIFTSPLKRAGREPWSIKKTA